MARRALLLVMLICLAAAWVMAQDAPPGNKPKAHDLAQDPGKALLDRSEFAHGYLHGYDEGYHQGDLDVQLARAHRNFHEDKLYRTALLEDYRPGDRGTLAQFRLGYRQGYVAGYMDSFAGRMYRGVGQVQVAAAGLLDDGDSGRPFSDGFMAGYGRGRSKGGADAQNGGVFDVSERACPTGDAQYCAAFARGFGMGYPDGYLEALDAPPPPPPQLRASKKANPVGVQTASAEGSH